MRVRTFQKQIDGIVTKNFGYCPDEQIWIGKMQILYSRKAVANEFNYLWGMSKERDEVYHNQGQRWKATSFDSRNDTS